MRIAFSFCKSGLLCKFHMWLLSVLHPYDYGWGLSFCAFEGFVLRMAKGTNEHLNGPLRAFYPKGRNLSRAASAARKRDLALINARSRKVFSFHSAQELWDLELLSCCTWFDKSLEAFQPPYSSPQKLSGKPSPCAGRSGYPPRPGSRPG